MNYQKVELHISQIERFILSARSKFPETKKQAIYDSSLELLKRIKSSNYKFDNRKLAGAKFALDLVFKEILFLHYDREDEIPQLLIECLKLILADWIPSKADDYFIAINLNNTAGDFYQTGYDESDLQQVQLLMKTLFGHDYKQSVIQISKPKHFVDDFLSSVPVYHEFGHFIDKNYQISSLISRDKSALPLIDGNRCDRKSHIMEHFADIFAAQYIGMSSLEPLSYISPKTEIIGNDTHPSNINRIEVVQTFLDGKGSSYAKETVDAIKRQTFTRTKVEIKNRMSIFKHNPFIDMVAIDLGERNNIHSLFSEGWKNWLDQSSYCHQKYSDSTECANAINNLIKQCIHKTLMKEVGIPEGSSASC